MANLVLTRPQGGGIPGTISTGIYINPGETKVVDGCSCGSNRSVKWIYTLMDDTSGAERIVSAEVLANHRNSTPGSESHNWAGVVGDRILHNVDVELQSGTLRLKIRNNDTTILRANIVRIQLLS